MKNFGFPVSDLHFLNREKHQCSIVHHRKRRENESKEMLGLIWFGRDGVGLGRDDLIAAESPYDRSKSISADPAKEEECIIYDSSLRTSVHMSTGVTPYSLVYGIEAVLPVEVEIPSLRVLAEAELDEFEWV
ncbi:hypothetical protein CR513_47550, partial [Mucuna pruriens]